MAAVQLSFTLRTSSNAKTVHLLGSWDNYAGQLPLAKDKAKKGGWKGTFRFQGSTLQRGQRYWYYYIVDGYHVSHDPAQESTTEPTTGRVLNILDVPPGSGSSISKRREAELPHKGRPLSASQMKHPRPEKPYATQHLYSPDYNHPTVDELTTRFSASKLGEEDVYLSASPPSSVGSSLSSRSSSNSPSSASSISDYSSPGSSLCKCERYGITRKGDRVKIDCGGERCGYSDSSGESCSSSDSEGEHGNQQGTRRQTVVVRPRR